MKIMALCINGYKLKTNFTSSYTGMVSKMAIKNDLKNFKSRNAIQC